MAKDPTEVIQKAVLRMLPRNKLVYNSYWLQPHLKLTFENRLIYFITFQEVDHFKVPNIYDLKWKKNKEIVPWHTLTRIVRHQEINM